MLVNLEIEMPASLQHPKKATFAAITRVTLDVTALDEAENFEKITKELTLADSIATGTVEVSQGRNRIFFANAFNETGQITYCGADTVNTLNDGFEVNIELQSKKPSAIELAIKAATRTSVTLSWTSNHDTDFAAYRLFRSEQAGVDFNSDLMFASSLNSDTEFLDDSILPEIDYFYKIFVFDSTGLFAASNEVKKAAETIFDLQLLQIDAPPSLQLSDSLTISWQVKNASAKEISGSFTDSLWINDRDSFNGARGLARFVHPQGLPSSLSSSVTLKVALPEGLVPGPHYLLVKTNVENSVLEQDTTNNQGSRMISIEPPQRSDLVVQKLQAPDSIRVGETVVIDWRLQNQGTRSTSENFIDRIWLGAKESVSNALLLEQFEHTSPLATGQTHDASAEVPFPDTLTPGAYFLIIQVDADDRVPEQDENNNLATQPINIFTEKDLVIVNVSAPDSAFAGEEIWVSWEVKNIGRNTVMETYREQLSITSSADTIGVIPIFLAKSSAIHTQDLQFEGLLRDSLRITIPTGLAGWKNILVEADVDETVAEIDEENNRTPKRIFIRENVNAAERRR